MVTQRPGYPRSLTTQSCRAKDTKETRSQREHTLTAPLSVGHGSRKMNRRPRDWGPKPLQRD